MPESGCALAFDAVSLDWARLYEEHAGELVSYLARFVGDRDAASDLTQETFARALRSDYTIREPRAVRSWLFQTATNLARNERRRRAVLRFVQFTGFERSAGEAFDLQASQVSTALRSISADEAATLLLRYHSGFTRAEIATMLGIAEETAKSRLARGRKNFMAAYRRLERGLAR